MVTLDQHECSHPVAPDLLARPKSWPARGRHGETMDLKCHPIRKACDYGPILLLIAGENPPGTPSRSISRRGSSQCDTCGSAIRSLRGSRSPSRPRIILDLLADAVGHQAQL